MNDIHSISCWCIQLTLYLFAGLLAAEDEFGLKVNFEHITVNVGDKPDLLCSTKKDAVFLISNPLQWVQVGRGNDVQPRLLSSLGKLREGLDEFRLDMVNSDESRMAFKLSFKQGIRKSHDGYFKCQIADLKGNVLTSKTVEVHVIRIMEKMSFSFGGITLEDTKLPAFPIRVKEGTYDTLCKVERSNPKADVKIFLDNVEQTVTTTSMKDTSVTDPPQAFNVQSVVDLQVNPKDKDKHLKCVAMVNNDPTMKREIQFTLDVYSTRFSSTADQKSDIDSMDDKRCIWAVANMDEAEEYMKMEKMAEAIRKVGHPFVYDKLKFPPLPGLYPDPERKFKEIRELECRNSDVFICTYPKADLIYDTWFNYYKEWETIFSNSNILPVYYHEMKINLTEIVLKIANFLDIPCTIEFANDIARICDFAEMKKNKTDFTKALNVNGTTTLFRKGQEGDWKHVFTVSQNDRFDALYAEQMKDSNLVYRMNATYKA